MMYLTNRSVISKERALNPTYVHRWQFYWMLQPHLWFIQVQGAQVLWHREQWFISTCHFFFRYMRMYVKQIQKPGPTRPGSHFVRLYCLLALSCPTAECLTCTASLTLCLHNALCCKQRYLEDELCHPIQADSLGHDFTENCFFEAPWYYVPSGIAYPMPRAMTTWDQPTCEKQLRVASLSVIVSFVCSWFISHVIVCCEFSDADSHVCWNVSCHLW